MKLRSFNAKRAVMYGHELTPIQRGILAVSKPQVHNEVQFGVRHGYKSFSATIAEDWNGARIDDLTYSHPEYWDTINILVSIEEEDLAWEEAMKMVDKPTLYDTIGIIGLATGWDIIKPDPNKTWCSKACARVICAARPTFGVELVRLGYTEEYNINPADLFMLAMNWFK